MRGADRVGVAQFSPLELLSGSDFTSETPENSKFTGGYFV
jgi:hypothetical protein